MTTIEIGLTVAVVVLFVGLLLVWRMAYCSRVDCAAIMTKAVFAEGSVKGQWNRIESVEKAFARLNDCGLKDAKRLDDLLAEYARLKAELAQFIKLANGSEQKRDARVVELEEAQKRNVRRFQFLLKDQLAPAAEWFADILTNEDIGKVIADEVLTLPEPTFAATAYVDGGHAACDEQPNVRRVRSSDELDALAELVRGSMQPRATDFDLTAPDADPETAEAQPQPDDDQATAVNDVQAVEERFESLGYVAKESA